MNENPAPKLTIVEHLVQLTREMAAVARESSSTIGENTQTHLDHRQTLEEIRKLLQLLAEEEQESNRLERARLDLERERAGQEHELAKLQVKSVQRRQTNTQKIAETLMEKLAGPIAGAIVGVLGTLGTAAAAYYFGAAEPHEKPDKPQIEVHDVESRRTEDHAPSRPRSEGETDR